MPLGALVGVTLLCDTGIVDSQSGEREFQTMDSNPREVFCVKFQKKMEGLAEVPFDGHPLGQRIYDNVSKEAWLLWVERMKMIMNEYRLNLGTREAQEFLLQQMEEYFFGEGAAFPPDYVPTAGH
jgi:Fe-S cluster biosynthesis and repair protein YggX